MGLGEFELIARYFAPLSKGFAGAYGLLDDVAVISPAPGRQIVAKTDAIVAGVHFLPDEAAEKTARKALRVNLSDLAAKGAESRFYMLALMLPKEIGEDWIAAFAQGLASDQQKYGVHLIGGDTNATPGPLTVAVTLLGEVESDKSLRRSGAKPGDLVFVTGSVGDASLGLAALNGELPELAPRLASRLIERYRTPEPRVAVGPRLIGLARASIDISDGLVADLGHIAAVSGVSAVVDAALVPLSGAAREALSRRPELLRAALTGGDDYEILFTAPPEAEAGIEELAQITGVRITRIGRIEFPLEDASAQVRVLDAEGAQMEFARAGWAHFRPGN